MEGDDRLWKINTAPVARLFQNKVSFNQNHQLAKARGTLIGG